MEKVDLSLCKYEALEPANTHSFIFTEGSRGAVKAFAQRIESLQVSGKWYGKGTVFLLLDAQSALGLPIRYLFEIISDYNRVYPDLDPPHIKMAFVRSPDTVILDIYHMMAELFEPPLTVQFFTESDRAERWLLTDS
ncbi:MAG: hypothetical protein AAFV98_04825 [Chloroflexota bacterium]